MSWIKHINEHKWFDLQQNFLRWLASSDYGRDLLSIPKDYGRIIKIRPGSVTADEGDVLRSDYRCRNKYGNLVRHRWKEVQEAWLMYQRSRFSFGGWKPALFPLAPTFNYAYTTSTYYPVAGSGTAPMDGIIRRTSAGTSWSDITTGTGTSVIAGQTATDNLVYAEGFPDASSFDEYRRFAAGFPTTDIGTNDISSVTISLWLTANEQQMGDTDIDIVGFTPVDGANFATGDYNSFGTTRYATGIALSAMTANDTIYTDWTFNATGRSNTNKTTNSYFGFRIKWDTDNNFTGTNAGNGNFDRIQGFAADATGTSKDPKLVVVHAAAAASTPSVRGLMGVGM